MIPDAEHDSLLRTIGEAVVLAESGRAREGYHLLEERVEYAQAARESGEEWGADLEDLARAALENYARTHDLE